jgi:phosphomannomutase/phosphoglucomutase
MNNILRKLQEQIMISEHIFREYDIRGIAGDELTYDTAISIGKAFGCLLKKTIADAEFVSVGRDVRLSSEELSLGIIEGIISAGLNVYDIGVCPTPLQYFSLFHLNLEGGVMVTGSHNPPEYNGFKISIGKDTIHGDTIQTLKNIIRQDSFIRSSSIGVVKQYDISNAYKKYMFNEFSYLNSPKYRRIKVVVDAGNGTAGAVAPELLEGMGCDVIRLYCEPDGRFPNHHPDPTVVEYIQDLIRQTKEVNADFGVGYDGDSDRIGVVDSSGEIIWGDQIMIILSREILKHNEKAKIIGDVKCSQLMFDDIQRHGGVPIMWKTGHSLVKQKMKEEHSPLAGEFSGHIFIKDGYYGYDDAIYTTLRLVEIMKKTGKNIKELLSDVHHMYNTPEIRIDCPDTKKKEVMKQIVSRFIKYRENGNAPYHIRDIKTIDGIRVVFEKGWGLMRTSNTQPVIVMRIESEDEESLNGYREFLEKELNNAMGGIL